MENFLLHFLVLKAFEISSTRFFSSLNIQSYSCGLMHIFNQISTHTQLSTSSPIFSLLPDTTQLIDIKEFDIQTPEHCLIRISKLE